MSEQAARKKSSAGKVIGFGCLIAAILAVVGGILLWQGAKSFINETVEKLTDTEPMEFAAVELRSDQATTLEHRVRKFHESMEQDRELEPLELDSEEINYLITQNKDFANLLRVQMQDEQLEGTVSVALDKFSQVSSLLAGLKGRYLNGSAVFDMEFRNGRLEVYINSMTVKGEKVPDHVMIQIRNENFAKDATKDPNVAKFLSKLESISIEDGKLKIVPKPNAPEPTPPPADDAPKKTEEKGEPKTEERPAEAKN